MHYAELAIRKLIQKKEKKGIYNANIVMVEVITLVLPWKSLQHYRNNNVNIWFVAVISEFPNYL